MKSELGKFVFCRLNGEKGEGPQRMKQFQVVAYPTFIVLDQDGATIDRWSGYDHGSFLASTGASLQDPTTIEQKLARFDAAPTAPDAAKLAGYHDSRGEYADAVKFYRRAQELNQDPGADYLVPIFDSTFYGMRKKAFTPADLAAAADAVFSAEDAEPENLIDVAGMVASAAGNSDGKPDPVPYIKQAVERTEASPDSSVQKARWSLMPAYALRVLNDPQKAVDYKKKGMPGGWMTDAGQLNSFAWWCFENKVNLDEAQALAEKGVDLADPGRSRAMILDTVAEIANARGDAAKAAELEKRALADDPGNKTYQQQVDRFRSLAGGKALEKAAAGK